MGANRVFLNNDGLIEIVVDGDQTVESVQAMGDEALKLAKRFKRDGKRVLMLDNILKIGTVPPEARHLVVELIRSHDYDKFAMLGKGTLIRLGANLMLQATGKGSRVKYFEHYAAALAWLRK